MELSEKQRFLLLILRRNPVAFTGGEPEEEHLAMLQLWMMGLVERDEEPAAGPIRWRITSRGTSEVAKLLR